MLLTNRFTTDARVQREARTVASLGHELVVHALAGPGLPAEEERDGYRVRRHAEPAWIGWTGPRRAWPLLRWYSRYAFLAAAAEKGRPEIVHAHDLETLLPGGRLARRLGARFVYDDHELGLEKLGQGTAEWLRGPRRWASDAFTAYLRARGASLEGTWIRRADALVTACPMYGEVLEERYGVPPVVLCNTPLRSDLPPDPRLRERAGLPPSARVALYQGTITPAGGADECIDAAARFPEGWALVFLGVTWMRGRLEERARRAGAAERVRFLDPVPPSELPGWTRAADAGLAPIKPLNKGQAYSLANKLFEYMHAGIPQIVSDIPAQAALVREERAGVVLPEVSAEAIARAVAEIAAVPEAERRADGERLRARARERWCWEVEGRKLEALYGRLAGADAR
jgi:glycosyltransferase involved in cell wall biosynthesis